MNTPRLDWGGEGVDVAMGGVVVEVVVKDGG